MSKIALVWIGAILCSAAFSQSVVTASLSGTVFGSNGLPVGGAVVTASRTSVVPWTTSRASSALDGSFALSGLAQGTHQFCVQVPAGGYLNPCNWLLTPPATTTVATGGAVTGFQLTIPVGSVRPAIGLTQGGRKPSSSG